MIPLYLTALKAFIPAKVAYTVHDYCFIALLCHYLCQAGDNL